MGRKTTGLSPHGDRAEGLPGDSSTSRVPVSLGSKETGGAGMQVSKNPSNGPLFTFSPNLFDFFPLIPPLPDVRPGMVRGDHGKPKEWGC